MAKSKPRTVKSKWSWPLQVRPTARTAYQIQMGLVATVAIVTALLLATLVKNLWLLADPPPQPVEMVARDAKAYAQLRSIHTQINALEADQAKDGVNLIDNSQLQRELATVQVDLAHNNTAVADALLIRLQHQLTDLTTKLAVSVAVTQPPLNTASLNVPIVFYHNPPSDFGHQMDLLARRGYTTITLDQLAAALVGKGTLPPKPVIITFDDGLESQLPATTLLSDRRMKATFFIIDGGAASHYCIGASRHLGTCGDAYLTWSQIRQIDRNPLFTIASHTVDHLDLAQQSVAVQRYQIISGKRRLEHELGHSVDDFAYPYGSFNATTVSLVHQAGFIAAVSTTAGTTQTIDSLLTLKRIRATYDLP